MAVAVATSVSSGRFAHLHAVRRWLGVAGLTVVLLLPVWWWPLVASQDGLSHLYNACVLNESLAGRGPSVSVYEIAWKPVPNWGDSLILMGLLKIMPLSVVPRLMLSLTALALMSALVWLRRQICGSDGFLWIVAAAGCLATGRAWALGFEGFSLGAAAALCVIGLYERNRERLDFGRTMLIASLLALTYFCHLVPWVFAILAIFVLSLTGLRPGVGRRLAWTGAILLTALPCLVLYRQMSAASGGGFELDWTHLEGFHAFGVRSWLRLIGRADCMSVVSNRIPFTDVGPRAVEANHVVPATHVVTTAIMRLLISPFALFSFAVVVQAIATFVVDARTKDYRRVGWLVLGLGGMTLALFIPDSTVRNGMFLPFRLMLLSLALLAAAVRFDGGRLLHAVTGLLVAAAFVLHAAAIWDYAATANRQLLQVREAAAFVPAGQRIFQIGTTRPAKFRADPLLHADGYVALLRRGILLSNYEAGHYYFPVKLRPEYPPTLISQFSQLQELDPARTGDLVLTRQFLQKHRRFIDVLIVRTVDEQLARLAQRSFGELLCHSGELWVFDQRRATKKSQDGQARKDRD